MCSLGPVHRDHGISPRIVPVLDFSPRRILLLHERLLAALRTVPRNLQTQTISRWKKIRGHNTTHVAVLLASVARLDRRLGAVHVLRDGIRRSQTVPRHMIWPAAAITLDGRERSDVKTTSRRRHSRRKPASSTTTTAACTSRVFYSFIRTHTRDMTKVTAVLQIHVGAESGGRGGGTHVAFLIGAL